MRTNSMENTSDIINESMHASYSLHLTFLLLLAWQGSFWTLLWFGSEWSCFCICFFAIQLHLKLKSKTAPFWYPLVERWCWHVMYWASHLTPWRGRGMVLTSSLTIVTPSPWFRRQYTAIRWASSSIKWRRKILDSMHALQKMSLVQAHQA